MIGLMKGVSHDQDIVTWTKEALVQLLDTHSNIHLFLIGKGYDWLQGKPRCHFLGAISDEKEKFDIISACDKVCVSHFSVDICSRNPHVQIDVSYSECWRDLRKRLR